MHSSTVARSHRDSGAKQANRSQRERFATLAQQWEHETGACSNTEQIADHPAYKEIISMGSSALPLILYRLRHNGGHWFHALHAITGKNPCDPQDVGNVPMMEKAWLEWGYNNGLIKRQTVWERLLRR